MTALSILLLLVFLLLALTDTTAGLSRRKYIFYSTEASWSDAQTYCRANYVDLSILNSQLELDNFMNQTVGQKSEACWIGLNNNPQERAFTLWTDGSKVDFQKWKNGKPDHTDTAHCVFTANNEWENEECSKLKKSFCYIWTPKMIVVQEMKSWDEALVHCRKHYTDLVSITTEKDLVMVNNIGTKILTLAFWTGLHFMDGSWFWVNKDSQGSLASMPRCPARPYHCGALNLSAGVWENRDCEEKMNFICYSYTW